MMAELETRGWLLHELERELHDMCQPLTTLQCRLELGRVCGDPAALLDAVDGGLIETERLFARIREMRELLTKFERNEA